MIGKVLGAQHVILDNGHYVSALVNDSVLSQSLLGGLTVSEGLELILLTVLSSEFSL